MDMDFQIPAIDFTVILPFLFVAGAALLIMLVDLIFNGDLPRRLAPWISLVGLLGMFISSVALWDSNGATFTPAGGYPMVVADNFAIALNLIFAFTGALTIFLSWDYLKRTDRYRPEFYMLMMLSLSGMMLMGMANDLILIFMALELLSIPLYILAGYAWPRPDSEEAAMKYFLLGAFSSAIFIFGVALVYGGAGTTSLPGIFDSISGGNYLLLAGGAMIIVGLGFKVAAVPFHMWTPDVYEGSPTPVTAFMSVGAKVAGFGALLRILIGALPVMGDTWVTAIAVLSALTLIIGNFVAVAASYNVPDGLSAALFYMFAYAFTNLGAFAIVIAVEKNDGQGVLLEDYKGLGKRYPWMAIAMTVFMLSLTGIPPTAGFAAKFYVFSTAIEAGLIWLALIGIATSVVSAYYYLRVVFLMYMYDGEGEMTIQPALVTAVVVALVATLLVGILPGTWFDLAREAIIQSTQALAAGG
jgi:NADH-quinone oxidoreductase subunit N